MSSCIFTREEFRHLSHERWKEHLKRCEYCRNYKPKKYYTLDPYAKPDFLTRDVVDNEWTEVTPQEWIEGKIEEKKEKRENLKQRINGILVGLIIAQVSDEKPQIWDYAEKILQEIDNE